MNEREQDRQKAAGTQQIDSVERGKSFLCNQAPVRDLRPAFPFCNRW